MQRQGFCRSVMWEPGTLLDYRVFVTACLAGGPDPASETALVAFRRALEGTLASPGAQTCRLEPDGLLSLAAELAAPDMAGYRDGGSERPLRRWAPRDRLHEPCMAPGRALTVHPTGVTTTTPTAAVTAARGRRRRAGANSRINPVVSRVAWYQGWRCLRHETPV